MFIRPMKVNCTDSVCIKRFCIRLSMCMQRCEKHEIIPFYQSSSMARINMRTNTTPMPLMCVFYYTKTGFANNSILCKQVSCKRSETLIVCLKRWSLGSEQSGLLHSFIYDTLQVSITYLGRELDKLKISWQIRK